MAQGIFSLKQVNQAIRQSAWSALNRPQWVEYLCVAGGGGAGFLANGESGGGGAGGFLTGMIPVTVGTSYTVTVGGGGAGGNISSGVNGDNSVFGPITALGGGQGARYGVDYGGSGGAKDGGSGGGGAQSSVGGPASGTPGQGNAGGQETIGSLNGAGGGGGAGTIGLSTYADFGGNGGAGIASVISGTVRTYSGGGGGASQSTYTGSLGGAGGGGNGHGSGVTSGQAGGGNTGGGGGGGGDSVGTVAAGGSGIVVVRYPGTTQFFTGGTLSYANGYVIHTFYASGTLAPTAPTLYANPDYQISRSLRFNSADNPYLTRSFTTSTSDQIMTFSFWCKLSTLGAVNEIIGTNRAYSTRIEFGSGGDLKVNVGSPSTSAGSYTWATTALYRDTSAWYHVVCAIDTTQATATNRVKLWVNGVEITSFATQQTITQNINVGFSSNSGVRIGYTPSDGSLGAYLTEFNYIDGQALTPSSFGWTNPNTGVWAPLDFVGTYGTNGFNLNFSDNTNTTAATLGADSSGNGNNFTPNNFSVSAGVGNDSLVDSPTSYGTDTGVGGEVRGNYCTWNPLTFYSTTYPPTLTNGNLDASVPAQAGLPVALGTLVMPSGQWYWEVTITAGGAQMVGIADSTAGGANSGYTTANGWYYYSGGQRYTNNVPVSYGATFTVNDVIGIALDIDAGTLVFYKNGASQGTAYSTGLTGKTFVAALGNGSGAVAQGYTGNFGQRPFAYTAPSGYKALCTQNLPTPTIGATSTTLASEFFDTSIWAANGDNVNPRLITSNVDLANGGGLIWIKGRDVAVSHYLVNSVRGYTKYLATNGTTAEDTYSTGFAGTTNGFTFTGSSSSFNQRPYNYVGWQWKAGGTTAVTNTSGSITSTISANPTSGFSIVTYTGTGANATIGHGLGAVPSVIITKNLTQAGNYFAVYTSMVGNTMTLWLSSTDAAVTSSQYWNNTTPTSSVFSVGSAGPMNGSTHSMLAYCFAPIAGYSAFGSYTGNGSADGAFVFTGFRPALVMIKRTSSTGDWFVYNNKTSPSNVVTQYNVWNSSGVEGTYSTLDFFSNGFKLRVTDAEVNGNGSTMIYMAFAENPFKYSLAR